MAMPLEQGRVPLRARLLDVGAELLQREGVAALTTERLAEGMEVAPAVLLAEVGEGVELLRAVHDEAVARFDDAVAVVAEHPNPLVELLAILGAHRRYGQAQPGAYGLLFDTGFLTRLASSTVELGRPAATPRLARTVDRGIEKGELRPVAAEDAALVLHALVHGLVVLERNGQLGIGADAERRWTDGVSAGVQTYVRPEADPA